MLLSTHLLSIKITTSPKEDILSHIKKYLQTPKTDKALTIFTPNPEQIVEAQNNNFFKHILNESDINLPDGVGIIWALKHVSRVTYHVSRISGIDFMYDLIQIAVDNHFPVAFIGGRDGVAQQAFENLQKKYPKLSGWVEEIGEVKLDQLDKLDQIKQLANRIQKEGIKLVFVGLGAPKQEMFIEELRKCLSLRAKRGNLLNNKIASSPDSHLININDYRDPRNDDMSLIFMSVGGSFDIISGKLKRAPKIIQQLNLEWLWRLLQEPWRIGRQLKLLKFVFLVFKARFVLK